MKITRLVHSCILVEHQNLNYLIDPGQWSFDDKQVNVNSLPKIDYILITHWHEDHCSPKFIETIIEKSPDVKIISNGEVANVLAAHHIRVETEPPENVEMQTLKHAKLWVGMEQIQNSVFTLFGQLTHFGDNRQLGEVNFADTVAFPITAPWGSMADAVDKLIENPPKRVIPIHDWHLSQSGRDYYYQRMQSALKDYKVEFISLMPTESIDIT